MCGIKQAHSRWPTRQVRKPQRQQNKGRTEPDPARERIARYRSILEIAVLCHLPKKTSQITAAPEEWSKDEETQKFA